MTDQPPPRRRFQFRLRTLLIVVTLLAAQCAFVTWVIRDRQRLIDQRAETFRHGREEAMAWMYREHQAQAEADSLKAKLRASLEAQAEVDRVKAMRRTSQEVLKSATKP
jgi:hypothetical protein